MSKTLGLAMIVKNEAAHLPRIAENIKGIFDQWVIVDTGSTDGTVEIAKSLGAEVHHFEWIKDFSAARNESLKYMTTDYVAWMDGDDSIRHPEALLEWKRTAMASADMWFVNYNYALLPDKTPACTFIRERVFKNESRFKFQSFCHEGLDASGPINAQFIGSWAIDHLRSPEDLAKDKGRNLGIFEHHLALGKEFDPRSMYYYGKELFEAGRPDDALKWLMKANSQKDLQIHDRTLCIQYAVYILMQKNEFVQAINLAMSGLLLQPQRAEFYVLIADCYIKMERFKDAMPYYEAAKACEPLPEKGFGGFIFQNRTAYTDYPRNQLSRIWAQLGQHERGAEEAKRSYELYKGEESKALFEACSNIIVASTKYKTAKDDDAIVFTCPGGLYEWDSKIYRERGIGGSETACVEMATWLKKLTKRSVIVFNQRATAFTDADGVEYRPLDQMHGYFGQSKPKLHVAWRHNFKMTDAKTVVWSHDLIVPHGEKSQDYDKYLALSGFHKQFVKSMLGVEDEKIFITRNGVDPKKLVWTGTEKNPNKVIFVSSPDRGLDRAIEVCEIARANLPDLELHVYYGLDNLIKMGKVAEVEHFKKLMDKPWIHYHGNMPQSELIKEYQDAAIWLYPTNFLETFCISALETVLSGIFPLVRKYGALPWTLEGKPCTIIDRDCVSFEDKIYWAKALVDSIEQKMWHTINQQTHSEILGQNGWEQVSREWIREFLDDDSLRRND